MSIDTTVAMATGILQASSKSLGVIMDTSGNVDVVEEVVAAKRYIYQ